MSTKTALSVAERVANGVQWLDERWPDWVRAIDLDDLDLADSCNCILGQKFGDFDDALDGEGITLDEATTMGFFAGFPDKNRAAYFELNEEWYRVIAERREAAKA